MINKIFNFEFRIFHHWILIEKICRMFQFHLRSVNSKEIRPLLHLTYRHSNFVLYFKTESICLMKFLFPQNNISCHSFCSNRSDWTFVVQISSLWTSLYRVYVGATFQSIIRGKVKEKGTGSISISIKKSQYNPLLRNDILKNILTEK